MLIPHHMMHDIGGNPVRRADTACTNLKLKGARRPVQRPEGVCTGRRYNRLALQSVMAGR